MAYCRRLETRTYRYLIIVLYQGTASAVPEDILFRRALKHRYGTTEVVPWYKADLRRFVR